MFEIIVTLALAAFAIWLLVDSAVEYIRTEQESPLPEGGDLGEG